MKDIIPSVKEQYENYPYPPRDPQDEYKRLIPIESDSLEVVSHYCFDGGLDYGNMRVLIAGGGTGDSAIYLAEQLRGTDSKVIYLDMSEASMRIAQKRAEIRGLRNIEWRPGSLLSLPEMDLEKFDYINCIGVLHHLKDPQEGLKALKSVLNENGAVHIMVYAAYGRTGVYQMQNLLKIINKNEPDMREKISNSRALIESLPDTNWFKRDFSTWEHEINSSGDIGLYDLLLHDMDRSYTVPQIYEFVEACGLTFVEFVGIGYESRYGYKPENYIQDRLLREKLLKLEKREQQAAAELISGAMKKHVFYASQKKDTIAKIEELDNIPFFFQVDYKSPDMSQFKIDTEKGNISLRTRTGITIEFKPTKYSLQIFNLIDGETSLKKIFEQVRSALKEDVSDAVLLDKFQNLYNTFNTFNAMLLRKKNCPILPTSIELQHEFEQRISQ